MKKGKYFKYINQISIPLFTVLLAGINFSYSNRTLFFSLKIKYCHLCGILLNKILKHSTTTKKLKCQATLNNNSPGKSMNRHSRIQVSKTVDIFIIFKTNYLL